MILKSFFLSALLMGAALTAAAHKHTRHVDPFIGTAATGHTFPGATVPFGLVQPGPSSGVAGWKYCSGYIHSDARLWGFAQTHLNGTGCTDLGDLLIMPVSRQYAQIADTAGVAQSNDKVNLFGSRKGTETARPGYYGASRCRGAHGSHRHAPRSLLSTHVSARCAPLGLHRLAARPHLDVGGLS